MPCTLKEDAVRGFSSTFSFPKRTSVRSLARALMIGEIITHGPHHPAQKSTTNFPPAMVDAKFASVRTIGAPPACAESRGALHLPQMAFWPLPTGGRRLA
jgi:hypothetical protein